MTCGTGAVGFAGFAVAGPDVADTAVALARPLQGRDQRGRQLDPAKRKAIELYAVQVVTVHYERAGYAVKDVGAFESWDLTATRQGEELHIEEGHYDTVQRG